MTEFLGAPIPPGWRGGFIEKHPDFNYPKLDMLALPLFSNLENIDLIQRGMPVRFPEFSWKMPDDPESSRCFKRFETDISRLGYTDTGRVYSLICPQMGAYSPNLGSFNVEISITGSRGWVSEPTRDLAVDLTVEAKIWLSPSATFGGWMIGVLVQAFEEAGYPFPWCKKNAIRVSTHRPGQPQQPVLQLLHGECKTFKAPDFAKHHDNAWTVGSIEAQLGEMVKTNVPMVDECNEMFMTALNIASGNMLAVGSLLSWNIWFSEPEQVDHEEWRTHAKRWRDSIDADHGSPHELGSPTRHFDGTLFTYSEALDREVEAIIAYLEKHLLHGPRRVPREHRPGFLPGQRLITSKTGPFVPRR
jgi:hypothetical protein